MSDTQPADLLTYFATNAPADPPEWFKPDMENLPLPKRPEKEDFDDYGQPGPEWQAWRNALAKAEEQREEYRYFAWRWYYAEKMKASKLARQAENPAKIEPDAELDEVSRKLTAHLDAALSGALDQPEKG